MGPVVAIIAVIGGLVVAASSITHVIADNLQQQVNKIINSHADATNKLKSLQSLLQKLDFSKIQKPINKLNKILNDNLNLFINDQKAKINLLKKIAINKDKKQSTFWGDFLTSVGDIGTIIATVQLISATNPITAAIGLVISIITSIFSIIGNIKQINHLKKQKQELITYFQPGGKFEQQQKTIRDNSVLMVQNLYLMVVSQNNTLKMLDARISLLSYDYPVQFDYKTYYQQLSNNPFNAKYQNLIFQMLGRMEQISSDQSLSLSRQISRMNHILTEIVNTQHVTKRINQVGKIFTTISDDTHLLSSLQSQVALIGYLNTFRNYCIPYFHMRSHQDNTLDDPIKLAQLVQSANIQFPTTYTVEEHERYIAQTVSFFTNKFYGDDPTGETLFKYNLAALQKKTRFLNYIQPFASKYNFVLPKPSGPGQKQWLLKYHALINKFRQNFHKITGLIHHEFDYKYLIFISLYIKLLSTFKTVGDKSVNSFQVIYGISVQYHGRYYDSEMTFEQIYSSINPTIVQSQIISDTSILQSNSIQFVSSPPVIQGISYVQDGTVPQLLNTLQLINKGTQAEQNAILNDPKWSNYQINGQNLINFGKNFTGLCINFRDIIVTPQSIATVSSEQDLKQDTIAVKNAEALICSVLLNVAISMNPTQIRSISVMDQNTDSVNVRWSSKQQPPSTLDGKLLSCVESSVSDLKKVASGLKAEQKALFVVSITDQWKAFCWYLE